VAASAGVAIVGLGALTSRLPASAVSGSAGESEPGQAADEPVTSDEPGLADLPVTAEIPVTAGDPVTVG
jgi:hypothetical protein